MANQPQQLPAISRRIEPPRPALPDRQTARDLVEAGMASLHDYGHLFGRW